MLNLGLGLFLFSQFGIRVGNESLAFQRCMACWELFLLYYIIMMAFRFVRLILFPLDLFLSLGANAVKPTSGSRRRGRNNTDDDDVTGEEDEPKRFTLVLFPLFCKCEFGKVGEYFLSQSWYMQYYQTLASLGGGGRWLVTVFFPWYLENLDAVQRAELHARKQAGWTGFCCRNCCCCCCRPGELNPFVAGILAVVEEVLQNTGGILISYAILKREYPSDEDGDGSTLSQAAETRAKFSMIWGILSAILETGYLIGVLRQVLRERREIRQRNSNRSRNSRGKKEKESSQSTARRKQRSDDDLIDV